MPVYVDHEKRRREIVRAAIQIIAEKGADSLSLRGVAQKLGGSSTLVTHYFSSRKALLDHLADELAASWESDLEAIHRKRGNRLRLFLQWGLPLHDQGLAEERALVRVLADRGELSHTIFGGFDERMRDYVKTYLKGHVPAKDFETTVDVLRSLTVGITTMTLRHPDKWSPARQLRVLDRALGMLGLEDA